MVRLMAVLLMACALAVAQQRTPASRRAAPAKPAPAAADLNQPYPLKAVEVKGNTNFPDQEIIALAGLHIGQNVSKKDFDAAQQTLLATGLFETVAYRFDAIPGERAYKATLEVKEIEQLFPYRFEAIEGDQNAMREWLRQKEPLFKDRIPATEPVLKKMAASLEAYLASTGHRMNLLARLMPNSKNQMEVVFQPASLPAVAEIRFKGSKSLTNNALQQAVAGAAVGALYTENRFRQILDASVRPLFEAEGRLRVSFPKIETTPAADVKGVIVTVDVNEGDTYKLRNVEIAGPLAEDKAVAKRGNFRTGETANMTAVQESVKAIEASLKRRGYLKIDSDIQRKIDDKEKAVDVVINIDPGPQYKMGQLIIEGLDIQTEPHIRKLWALKPNQPFDMEYPDVFLSKMPEVLDDLGKTRSSVKPDPGTLKVDVTLYFEAAKRQPEKPKIP